MATNSDDILTGSQGTNGIDGLGGADIIYGLGGDDFLAGNSQDDTLIGGTGNDFLEGETGDDVIEGNDGDDTLIGGANDDRMNGGGEADFLVGNTGNDHMSGGGESDSFLWENGDGNDVNDGGSGEDSQFITGAEDGDIFTLDPNDVNTTSVFQRENLIPFNIQISNMELVDVEGRGGVDSFTVGNLAGTGIDNLRFDGGEGGDTLDVRANEGASVIGVGGEGADFFYGGNLGEQFFGGEGADHFFSGAGDDIIDAGDGNDQIFTGSGNDLIDAGTNDDTIVMGAGDDYIITGDGSDRIRYDLAPVAGGFDAIEDFSPADLLFLGGISGAQLDTNNDGVFNDADDLITYDAAADSLSFSFNATDQLSFLGVESLTPSDITFV
jgi:Ca2+-binding RTX toxin-like protein